MKSWLALLRAPNLFTVPGDVLAGACLAAFGTGSPLNMRVLLLIGASLCLYASGLVMNDWFDREVDRRERSDRPIPSGAVSPRAALAVAVILMLAGLGLAAGAGTRSLIIAAAVIAMAIIYNAGAKRVRMLGPLVMGSCRALNLILGASVALPPWFSAVHLAAAVEGLYIAAVSMMAVKETEGPSQPVHRALALVIPLAGLALLTRETGAGIPAMAASAVAVAAIIAIVTRPADHEKTPETIAGLLRALIPLQAAFIATSGEPLVITGAVLVLWPVSAVAGRRVQGS